jgi:hypothetical protein
MIRNMRGTTLTVRAADGRLRAGLGHANHVTDDLDQACHHWQKAITLYADLQTPDVRRVQTHSEAFAHLGIGQGAE